MAKKLIYTFAALLLLTVATAFISILQLSSAHLAGFLILSIAMVKIMLVAFQFMELKEAHRAWKVGFSTLMFVIGLSILLLIP